MTAVVAPITPTSATAAVMPREVDARSDDRDDFRAQLKRSQADAEAAGRAARKADAMRADRVGREKSEASPPPPVDDAPSPVVAQASASALAAATPPDPAAPGADEEQGAAPSPSSGGGFAALLPAGDAVAPPTLRERSLQATPPPPPTAATPAPIALAAASAPVSPLITAAPARPAGVAKATSSASPALTGDVPVKGADPAVVAPQGETTLSAEAVTAVSAGANGFGDDPQTLGGGQGDSSPVPPGAAQGATAPADATAAAPAAAAPDPIRGSPETVQSLAAEMVQRLDQRVSRFEVALNPAGLGRVDVRLEIGSKGGVSARLSCDRAGAADALKARGGELASLLRDAGFDVAADGLSFSFAEGGLAGGDLAAGAFGAGFGEGGSSQPPPAPAASGLRAFGAASGAFDGLPFPSTGRALRGLDIHV